MSQLMQLQIENERTFLTYKYKKVQDMDDVILQLLRLILRALRKAI